jgi:hypothetical protein
MTTLQKDRILQHRGGDLVGRDGEKIGSIEEIYLDAETNEPEWALVTTGLFGTKQTFVPLRDASEAEGGLSVPFDKSTVKDAPKIDPDGQLSHNEESELYRYYGIDSPSSGTSAGGTPTGDAMTRSEEELDVGTSERETGRARLRKYVVTEEESQTVPVRHEEIDVDEGGRSTR